MADYSMLEDLEKYQQYTGHLFIDIKTTFIIIYVYISVVNLISTTANNEANQHKESPFLFNLTSRPEHTNVNVSSIDDATLWSCREYSSTSSYYVTLYWMLLITFSTILLFYGVSKFLALWNIDNLDSLTDLWHMAVLKHIKQIGEDANYSEREAENMAKCYKDMLSTNISQATNYDEMKKMPAIKIRKLMPYLSLIGLISTMVFSALSYDLHLVSCISGIPDHSINYDNATQTVELRFTDDVIDFQQIGVFLALFSFIATAVFAKIFNQKTKKIVEEMKENVKLGETKL